MKRTIYVVDKNSKDIVKVETSLPAKELDFYYEHWFETEDSAVKYKNQEAKNV